MTERHSGATDDAALVRELAAGSEAALGILYDRYGDAIFAAAYRLTSDRGVAEEVVQETFLTLWNRAELFDPRAGSLTAWLHTIGRNRAVDRLRAAGRRPHLIALSSSAAPDESETQALERVVAGRHGHGWRGPAARAGRGGRRRGPAGGDPGRRRGHARRRANGDPAGLPGGAVADRDRRSARMAARNRQDADATGAPPPARGPRRGVRPVGRAGCGAGAHRQGSIGHDGPRRDAGAAGACGPGARWHRAVDGRRYRHGPGRGGASGWLPGLHRRARAAGARLEAHRRGRPGGTPSRPARAHPGNGSGPRTPARRHSADAGCDARRRDRGHRARRPSRRPRLGRGHRRCGGPVGRHDLDRGRLAGGPAPGRNRPTRSVSSKR